MDDEIDRGRLDRPAVRNPELERAMDRLRLGDHVRVGLDGELVLPDLGRLPGLDADPLREAFSFPAHPNLRGEGAGGDGEGDRLVLAGMEVEAERVRRDRE